MSCLGGLRESGRDRTNLDRFSLWRGSWARHKLWKSYSLRRRRRNMYVVGMWSRRTGQPCSERGRGKKGGREEDIAKRCCRRLRPHTCARPRPPSRQKDKNSAELSLSLALSLSISLSFFSAAKTI